ncbi:hypothetical protein SDC9_70390 [bioreactor metagenome]|uniref:Uncharacterized protein n=1 Tax=bioreactor metagenome TaxID=1076179 RepID=A0A644YBI4_9ZZZZ
MSGILQIAEWRTIAEIPFPGYDLPGTGQVAAVGKIDNAVITESRPGKPCIYRTLGQRGES